MRVSVAAVLFAAALLVVVVAASDAESTAHTSEDLSHMSAAERKLLGYIKVHGSRKNWINKKHLVHLLDPKSKVGYVHVHGSSREWGNRYHKVHLVDPDAADAPVEQNASSPQILYKYEKFPVQKILAPMKRIARALDNEDKLGLKRYKRLRHLLLSRGLASKEQLDHKRSDAAQRRERRLRWRREEQLRKKLAALHKQIALREAEAKDILATQKCDKGKVYFCRDSACSCIVKKEIVCGSELRYALVCEPKTATGVACHCHKRTPAERRAAAKEAARRLRKYVMTCSVRSAKCRHARELNRNSYYAKWTSRRKFLVRQYNKVYNRYVVLLAKYFHKKYHLMVRDYVRAKKKNIDLQDDLKDLASRHKAAMLHHAKLHQLAFMRYSQLTDSYRQLDARYNNLVDKYRIDLASASDRLKAKKQSILDEKKRIAGLHQKKAELKERIHYLHSEIAKAEALQTVSDDHRKALAVKQAALEEQYRQHEQLIKDALTDHDGVLGQLQADVDNENNIIKALHAKIQATKNEAKLAAENANAAYSQLKESLAALKKQAAAAARNNAAAMAALRSKNATIKAKIPSLEAQVRADRDSAAKHAARRVNRLDTLTHNHAKREAQLLNKLRHLRKYLHTTYHRLHHAKTVYRRASRRLARLNSEVAQANSNDSKLAAYNHKLAIHLSRRAKELRHRIVVLKHKIAHSRAERVRVSKLAATTARRAGIFSGEENTLRGEFNKLHKKYEEETQKTVAEVQQVASLRHQLKELRASK